MTYSAAILGGAAIGLLWGEAYFGHEARAAIGAGIGWFLASMWFESLDKTTRASDAQKRLLDQFERDMKP